MPRIRIGNLALGVTTAVVLGLVTGIAATIVVVIFVLGFETVNAMLLGFEGPWWWWPVVLGVAGLLVGLLMHWSGGSVQTVGDHALAVQMAHSAPSLRDAVATQCAAWISLSSGASVGMYGPTAHLGGLTGSLVARPLGGGSARANIAIACGVAAAIATAFNAPITGILFAQEVVLRHTAMRAFAPVTVAAIIGYIADNFIIQTPQLIPTEGLFVAQAWEFALFAVIGMTGALLSIVMMSSILSLNKVSRRWPLPRYLLPAIAGLITGGVALVRPEILGLGLGSVRDTLSSGGEVGVLAGMVTAKMAVTALCLGLGFVGGILSPTLFIGVMFGTLFGVFVQGFAPDIVSPLGVYGLCGLVALVVPAIGAPLTTMMLVFETTRSYDVAVAAIITIVFSTMVSYRLYGRSYFDRLLALRGRDPAQGRERLILSHEPIADLITQDCLTVHSAASVDHMRSLSMDTGLTRVYVVDEQENYVGSVSAAQLLAAHDEKLTAGDLARPDKVILESTLDIWSSLERLRGSVPAGAPVVESRENRKFLGIVPGHAVIDRYLKTTEQLHRDEID